MEKSKLQDLKCQLIVLNQKSLRLKETLYKLRQRRKTLNSTLEIKFNALQKLYTPK